MYFLIIACTSLITQCYTPPPFHGFKSAADCDKALIMMAKRWIPPTGEYKFNCIREDKI